MLCRGLCLLGLIACLQFGRALGFLEANWTAVAALDPDFWWDTDPEPDCEESSDGTFAVSGGELSII